jgi:hypothetical protein
MLGDLSADGAGQRPGALGQHRPSAAARAEPLGPTSF